MLKDSFRIRVKSIELSTLGPYQLELSLNVIIPPPEHCHRVGFGHRMENGLVRIENTDKILAILKGLGYNN